MDTRLTLNSKESFIQLLKDLYNTGTKASLLYDHNGLTRYEGLIKNVINDSAPRLLLEEDLNIPVSSVVAVNGVFAPDYSEC